MTEQAQEEISARNKALYDAMNRDDFDFGVNMYTDDCAFMIPDGPIVSNKADLKETFQKLVPALKNMAPGDQIYFELINESTAYVNNYVKSVDDNGKVKSMMRDALLWKKIDGVWYISRDIFHGVAVPDQ